MLQERFLIHSYPELLYLNDRTSQIGYELNYLLAINNACIIKKNHVICSAISFISIAEFDF